MGKSHLSRSLLDFINLPEGITLASLLAAVGKRPSSIQEKNQGSGRFPSEILVLHLPSGHLSQIV